MVMASILLLLLGFSGPGMAGINFGVHIPLPGIHVNISAPPAFVFPALPQLVVIPGTYVYYCPDAGFDVFFYDGYWYRPYEGYWYRSISYHGPWAYIDNPPYVVQGVIERSWADTPYSFPPPPPLQRVTHNPLSSKYSLFSSEIHLLPYLLYFA